MTLRAVTDATRTALAAMLGADWTVHVTDDEWSAMQYLQTPPAGARAVFLAEEHRPYPNGPKGLAGDLTGRLVVQIRSGLDRDDAVKTGTLFDREEVARRNLLAIVFQIPGDPDFPGDWTEPGRPAHNEIGQFRHTGSGPYAAPFKDLMLEHPAREIRWSLPLALRIANNVQRVDVPLSAGA